MPTYDPETKERVGLQLLRAALAGDEASIVDIRDQHGVGADAIDDLLGYVEMKVYAGAEPERVSLTDAQVQRAMGTEGLLLAVIANVESSNKPPTVRLIDDPLGHLSVEPSSSLSPGGVRSPPSLVISFNRESRASEEDAAPEAKAKG